MLRMSLNPRMSCEKKRCTLLPLLPSLLLAGWVVDTSVSAARTRAASRCARDGNATRMLAGWLPNRSRSPSIGRAAANAQQQQATSSGSRSVHSCFRRPELAKLERMLVC